MLQNALNNPALNDAEKQGVQSAPKNRSLPDPETADMTEKERLSLYRQSERYRAYQERMQAWEAERKRQQAAAAYQRYRQGEWAETPKTPTPTATPTPVKPPPPPPTPPMPQGTPTLTATPAPSKTPQPVPAPTPPMPRGTPTAAPASVLQQSKPLRQRVADWLQDKVEKFVYHPPAWLSVSYSSGEFSLGNYTAAHWISYQPSARNFWESISYQQVSVELKTKGTLTTNPKGIVDVDLSDGTITFNTGPNSSFFIQPSALSIGWKSSSPPPGNVTPPNPEVQIASINQTVIDVDLFGKNMLSFKVSYATGMESSRVVNVNGTDVKITDEKDLDVTINVHRWPRIVMAAAALYFVFEAGAAAIAPRVIPWMVEKVPALAPLFVGP